MVDRTTVRSSVVKMAMVACQRRIKTSNLKLLVLKLVLYLLECQCFLAVLYGTLFFICSRPLLLDLFRFISTYAFKICFVLGRANALVRIHSTKTWKIGDIWEFERCFTTNCFQLCKVFDLFLECSFLWFLTEFKFWKMLKNVDSFTLYPHKMSKRGLLKQVNTCQVENLELYIINSLNKYLVV